jgi:hypothetical protein
VSESRSRVALLGLLCVLASCSRAKPAIYLDNEWSEYYARNTCYLTLPKADRDPGLEPCLARQTQALDGFERALLPQLGGAHPGCAGIVVGKITSDRPPPADTGFWRLLISLDDPTGQREPWDLMSPNGPRIHHGAGGAVEVARDVCDIASGRAPAGPER